MGALLSVDEVAGLVGLSRQGVLLRIRTGKLQASMHSGSGPTGLVYKISVDDLPEKARIKYLNKNRGEIAVSDRQEVAVIKPSLPVEFGSGSSFALSFKKEIGIEDVTKEQREKALWIKEMIIVWQRLRSEHKGNLADFDTDFLNNIKYKFNKDFSIHQLYRYHKAFKEFGEIGLVDFRGMKNKDKTDIDKDIWAYFEYLYLQENKLSAQYCYDMVKDWAAANKPDAKISSYSVFTRMIKKIPKPIITLYREGEKKFIDNCEMYMTRMVEDLQPNDIWVADNHTFDIISKKDGTEVKHRLYLTVFIDARTRLIVGFNVTDTPNSNSTLLALRNGIMNYGKPKMIYVDNGREFLTNDIGGRGHRKGRKKENDTSVNKTGLPVPPTILQLLEIKMINALPRNAKAKVIERWFKEFTEHFAKLFDTYVGSNPVERPEYTKYSVKSDNIVKDSEIINFVDRFINGYMNARPQNGRGMNGKTALEVWNENILNKVVVPKDKLNLLLMRISRPIMVKQNGVPLKIYNDTIWYYEEKFVYEHMNHTHVYLRYDPRNLSTVRVYDTEDRFMAELPLNENAIGAYISENEDISAMMKQKRRLKKLVKSEYNKRIYHGADRMTPFEIMNMVIDKNLEKEYSNNAVITEFEYEEKLYEKAVGDTSVGDTSINNNSVDDTSVDDEFEMLHRMTENIKKLNI